MREILRILRHGARPGAENMQVDERLLDRAAQAVLRFYGWDPPALSLGRFQDAAQAPPGTDLVRRVTGGGAIYHATSELTFSLVLPLALHPWAASPLRLYAATNRLWRGALQRLGVDAREGSPVELRDAFLCFDRSSRTDLVCQGRKLLGSAQRRTAQRVLIHGSLPLEPCPLAAGAISLEEAAGRPVTKNEVIDAFLGELAGCRALLRPTRDMQYLH